ncbi:MAG: hypothetical protein L6R35_002465 [Caloplaca aegaea]|nr:MAG: hypothetical protein L6R35_002465 [Caloplaca aegaea]
MSSKQDLAIFAGLVVFGFCATHVVHKQLLAVRKACEITSPQSLNSVGIQRREDAIGLETLAELSQNINDDIRAAAIKIAVDRGSKTKHLMLRDIASKNEEQRNRALTTIRFLYGARPQCFRAYQYTALQSIIDCLSYQLPLSHRYEIGRVKGPSSHRTRAECDALDVLRTFLYQCGVSVAVECNIFSLWLAKYPFGGDLEERYPKDQASQLAAKHRIIHKLSLGQEGDMDMSNIIRELMRSDVGREKMIKYNLIDPSGGAYDDTDHHDHDAKGHSQIWYEVHGISNAPDIGLGPMMRRGPRARDESLEEQLLRRRRREAMVLGEMGRPIERDDIIQRVDT